MTCGAAKEHGCTCQWWGSGFIVTFDSGCPVLWAHRGVPWNINQLTLFRV